MFHTTYFVSHVTRLVHSHDSNLDVGFFGNYLNVYYIYIILPAVSPSQTLETLINSIEYIISNGIEGGTSSNFYTFRVELQMAKLIDASALSLSVLSPISIMNRNLNGPDSIICTDSGNIIVHNTNSKSIAIISPNDELICEINDFIHP
eukprot:TRINITY_DN15448_c0_g1_i1.p1 TRINITY_DN15448_c0_g1~~TRINITY_DN15448_c0_g1_i1.p1  ORF type:complete len:149 (-),score=2.10 TRINITY_DN15448_c0_g1_i1:1-447(-)